MIQRTRRETPLSDRPRSLVATALLFAAGAADAQVQRPGRVNELYAQHCASCHGANLEGSQAPSMLDDVWSSGGDDESLARSIRVGAPEMGMPGWNAVLSENDIRSMVIFIREQHAKARSAPPQPDQSAESITVAGKLHTFRLDTWVDGLDDPWSLAFLTGDRALVTEKRGRLRVIQDGQLQPDPVAGVPEVDSRSQAGLYDVVPHPEYATNNWIYLAYSHLQSNARGQSVSLTRVIRGKLRDGALVDQETIYQAPREVYPRAGGVHFGGRIAFDRAGYLFFTIGERGRMQNAQDLTVPMGKIHRLFDDGRIPEDNPFVRDPAAAPTIWSYGHRNPQGLAFHPVTGDLYDVEHGPRGGDEVNWVRPGRNYGWPVITHGMNYDGTAITSITAREGMEQPVRYWTPSIAPCGASFYAGGLFPKWKNHLFVASLAVQELWRLEIKGDEVVGEEVLFKGLGRIRHVIGGSDGALYVLLPKRIVRLSPKE